MSEKPSDIIFQVLISVTPPWKPQVNRERGVLKPAPIKTLSLAAPCPFENVPRTTSRGKMFKDRAHKCHFSFGDEGLFGEYKAVREL